MSPEIAQAAPFQDTDDGRDSKGRFGVGNPGGPGRKPGTGDKRTRVSVIEILRRRYGEAELEDQVVAMMDQARLEFLLTGNPKLADLWLSQIGELPEKGPLVGINLGAGAPTGPPIPDASDFALDLVDLVAITIEAGVVEGEEIKVAEVVDRTEEIEDFLE